jgi:hypothetical protein
MPVFSMSWVRSSSERVRNPAANASISARRSGNARRIVSTAGCSAASATNVTPYTVSTRVV